MATVTDILHAIELVDNTLALVDNALINNPSKDDERALNRLNLRLEAERSELRADLRSLLKGAVAPSPSPVDIEQMAALSMQVEQATNSAIAASAAITLVRKSLDFAIDIATST